MTRPSGPGRDIGVGPGQVDVAGVVQRQHRDGPGMGQVGDVQDLDPFLVADEGVAELGLDGSWVLRGTVRRARP